MTENFFQSIEFANLLDVLALLSLTMALPLLLRGLGRLSRRNAALFLLGFACLFVSLFIETWQSTSILFNQFPVTPPLHQYLNLLFEILSFWLTASATVEWVRGQRTRAFFLPVGALVMLVGAVAGLGGIQSSALLPTSFVFRPEAEFFFVATKLAIALAALGAIFPRAREGHQLITLAVLFLVLRQAMELAQTQELAPAVAIAFEAATHLSLAIAAVVGSLALSDLDEIGVRARVFRVLLFGFVALLTVSVALSFNYLLRDRLLGESLSRYRAEATKITSDVAGYLGRLDRQVKSLATMELYSALAYPADPVQALASIPHQFLLEDFKSVGFYTAGGEVLHVYSQPGTEPALQSLNQQARRRLLNASNGSIVLRRNFSSHGSLFYEFERQLRIRRDRPEDQPELLFAAVVRDAGGTAVGYVEALFPTTRLTRFFSGYTLPGGWDFIANREGLILAHGNEDYAGYDVSLFEELFRETDPDQRWYRINLPGGSNYVVTEQVPGHEWVVARVISTGTMLGALRKLRGETLVILVVTLTVTLFVALIVSNFVNRQRITLERMAMELDLKRAIEEKNIELSVERQRIETILLSLGEGVIVLDARDRIMFVNRIAELMLGKSPAELIGTHVSDLHVEGLTDALERMVSEDEEAPDRPERARKPGVEEFVTHLGELDVRGNAAPIVREGEPDQGCVIIFQDISELMKVDRLKTEILSIVSHSLRTPLTSIKSFTEILQAKAGKLEPTKEREYLDIIDLSTDRLTRIVNNILDLSKIAGGKMEYSFRRTSLADLLDESVMVASGAAEGKGVGISADWYGLQAQTDIDRSKIMQVLDNILGNAIKFTPEGGTVSVFLSEKSGTELRTEFDRDEPLDPARRYALVEVRDTGVGISTKNLDRIFDRFFQDDYVRQSNEGGTGLGLAISKEYVLAHGGDIWAGSEPGKGSRFYIALPLAEGTTESGKDDAAA